MDQKKFNNEYVHVYICALSTLIFRSCLLVVILTPDTVLIAADLTSVSTDFHECDRGIYLEFEDILNVNPLSCNVEIQI